MLYASRPIILGVNPRFTINRCRVCSGGSMLRMVRLSSRYAIMAANSGPGSCRTLVGKIRGFAMENCFGALPMATTSSYRVNT